MLKVIIADDEARVCRLVQMLADWDALGMSVVGTASNGIEALELIETLAPDILITDIRMPGCSGLELIEKAKQTAPHLEIVLISGYAEFSYAQTALRHGVGGYLLKPIKKEELDDTLDKLGKKCRERTADGTLMENLRRESDKSHDLLRSRLFEDLLRKQFTPSSEQLQNEYNFSTHDGLFQVFILKMDYATEHFLDVSMDARTKAEKIFATDVFPLCFAGMFRFVESLGYGILNYEPQKSDPVRHALRQSLNRIEAQKFIFGNAAFSLALGKAVNTAEELPLSMRDAQLAVTERIVEGTGRLLETVTDEPHINQQKLLDKYNLAMNRILDTLDTDEADEAAKELEREARSAAGVRGYELLRLVLAAGKTMVVRFNMDEKSAQVDAFEARLNQCGSADRLFACLTAFQRERINTVRELRESESIRPIRLAKQYIQQHFSEQISLDDVCATIGFSASYFSTLFKKETGEGFVKYLARVRIEHAKVLLRETKLSVADICNQVGYNDLKHFTGTFKTMTSLNPGQYRKLYG